MSTDLRRSLVRGRLDGIVAVLARAGVTPNAITWAGFVVAVVAGLLAAAGHLAAAGAVSLLGGSFDLFDGALARATNQSSRFGALLDSTLDRYGEIALLLGVVIHAGSSGRSEVLTLGALALAGSLMVSYVKARAEGLGFACDVGILTRPERVILLGAALIIGLVTPALAIVAVLANFTAFQRLWHVWKEDRTQGGREAES